MTKLVGTTDFNWCISHGEMVGVAKNKSEDRDLRLADVTLAELVVRARKTGVVRVVDGEDVFEMRFLDDKLSNIARDFLAKGGKID